MLNEDYKDMLHVLSEEKVEFLLIGAYALAAYGYRGFYFIFKSICLYI
jgi:hypothetical protein